MKLVNKITFIFIVILYVLMSFNFEFSFENSKLFLNDFSDKYIVSAFIYEIILSIYLMFFGAIYFLNINEEFKSRLYASLIIESFVFAVSYIIFGYYQPFYIKIISNSIPLSYIIYSYIAYGKCS